MNIREAQLIVIVAIKALNNLLGLECLNTQVNLLKSLLYIEEVHVLISLFRRFKQLQRFISIKIRAA